MAAIVVEPGDVVARPSAVCSHGVEGYCHDDALPEERAAVDFLFRSAFEWASAHDGDRELAEDFAAWTVRDSWRPGVVLMEGSHPSDFDRFRAVESVR